MVGGRGRGRDHESRSLRKGQGLGQKCVGGLSAGLVSYASVYIVAVPWALAFLCLCGVRTACAGVWGREDGRSHEEKRGTCSLCPPHVAVLASQIGSASSPLVRVVYYSTAYTTANPLPPPRSNTKQANIMRELNHPNVVSIYDFYQEDRDNFYMVLEFMEGGELFGRIVKKARLYCCCCLASTMCSNRRGADKRCRRWVCPAYTRTALSTIRSCPSGHKVVAGNANLLYCRPPRPQPLRGYLKSGQRPYRSEAEKPETTHPPRVLSKARPVVARDSCRRPV